MILGLSERENRKLVKGGKEGNIGNRKSFAKLGFWRGIENVRESSGEKEETLKKFPSIDLVEQPLIQSR